MKLKLSAVLLISCLSMSAATITGDLDISGSVRIGADFADFVPLGGVDGTFNVEPTSTGSFTSLVVPITNNDGTILDLNAGIAPVGVVFSLPNFLTFVADPTLSFELTFIDPGAFAPCGGPSIACSVNQFNLVQNGNSVVANFNVRGNVLQNGVQMAAFVGSFSQSFAGQTIAGILGTVQRQGFIDSAFEGNFTTSAIPEPGGMSLFAIGSALTGVLALVRRKRS